MIYIFIIFFLSISIYLYDIKNFLYKKNEFFVWVVLLLWATSAFSYRLGSDVIHYMYEFDKETPTLFSISSDYIFNTYSRQPGWQLFVSFVKTIFPSFTFLKIIHAFIVNSIIASFIFYRFEKKFTGLLCYFAFLYFPLNFEVLRESISVVFFLLSVEYFLKKKWLIYYAYITIAISFHISAIPLLLLPIMTCVCNSRKKVILILIISIVFTISLGISKDLFYNLSLIESLRDKTTYYLSDSPGNGLMSFSNIINYILNIVMPIFVLIRSCSKNDKFFIYSPFICTYVLIYSISLQLPIFYRFNNYFNIFYFLSYIYFFTIILEVYSVREHIQLRRLFYVFGIFLFCFFKLSVLALPIGNIPGYYRFYPYSSIFTREVNSSRENIYRYLD